MKFIQKKPVKAFTNYHRSLFSLKVIAYLILLLLSIDCTAQDTTSAELFLMDKNAFNPYVEFVSTDVKDFFNPEEESAYPSTNLFDGNFKTCWVAGSSKTGKSDIVYVKLPAEIGGRAETTYLLVDLINRKIVNSQLEKSMGNYLFGNEIYFEANDSSLLYLMYNAIDGEYYQLELK